MPHTVEQPYCNNMDCSDLEGGENCHTSVEWHEQVTSLYSTNEERVSLLDIFKISDEERMNCE